MVITQTPFRISFFGGGTDYPDYYLKYGGKVIGSSINKFAYLTIRKLPPFFDYNYRIVYSKIESVKSPEKIIHPAVKHTLKFLNINYGISINYDGDLPARSGIGSSSSFTVGLLKGLYAIEEKIIDKKELAEKAIFIEQKLIKESVGSQDQTFASYGGFNKIEFLQNGEIIVNPILLNHDRLHQLQDNLMLFFSGISRVASKIAEHQLKKIEINKEKLDKMKELVDEAENIIYKNSLDEFGELLDYAWKLKRSLSENITNHTIEEIYNKAKKAGAIGGKLLGAGGGGFILFYVPKNKQEKVREALKENIYVPFKFEFEGSKIIFYRKENGI